MTRLQYDCLGARAGLKKSAPGPVSEVGPHRKAGERPGKGSGDFGGQACAGQAIEA